MTYSKIKEAAESRQSGESAGAWRLADALLAEVPAGLNHGGDRSKSSDVTTLDAIAARLTGDGIETPVGNPYTAATLRELRLVAMGWGKGERLGEAAFRTHQECGTSDQWKRDVLRALCAAARTQDWELPELDIDPAAWERAVTSVQRKVSSGTRYSVSANDLRTALKHKTNLPDRDLDAKSTAFDAIERIQQGREQIEEGIAVLAERGGQIDDVRDAIEGLIECLRVQADMLQALLSGGVSDEALADLLERG